MKEELKKGKKKGKIVGRKGKGKERKNRGTGRMLARDSSSNKSTYRYTCMKDIRRNR